MYEIKENRRELFDGTEITTYTRDVVFGCNGFEVTLGGDCELETMIRALKFITKVLEEESEEVYD